MAQAKGGIDFQMTIKGQENLARTLRRAGADLSDLSAAGTKVGARIVAKAQAYCPVRTGALRGSIRVISTRGGVTVGASQGLVYGPVQHWGWPAHHIRATLFLTKAFAETQAEAREIYTMDVRKAMAQVQGV